LPETIRSKMEAALGADFSDVRVHVGPQAERIGAIAFTTGSDIYFAPGRYQPDTMPGRQLLGHELAHVVQQRAGRVKNPLGSGLAIVQDRALEAEAERLGRQAAAHRVAAQANMPPSAAQPSAPVRIAPPVSAGPGSYRLTAGAGGRQAGSVMVHERDKDAVEVTDLHVAEAQRGHGIGRMLLASAMKMGQQFGKSKVTLAAQDNASGRLTQWYKGMGFAQVGVNQRGYPQLEAPITRVLAGTAQRQVAWRSRSTLQTMEANPDVKSGKALAKLAIPKTFRLPDKAIDAQNKVVDELEDLTQREQTLQFSPGKPHLLFCLGGIELSTDLNKSEDKLIKGAKLKHITPAKGVPDAYSAIEHNDKLKNRIVYFVITTLIKAGQIEYLKKSGLTNSAEWKIVVEVHYYRERNVREFPGFHKDTLGQTLFVNLNFVNPEKTAGPEYILNPELVGEHEELLKSSLPPAFRRHLSAVRRELQAPTEIGATEIGGQGTVVAFVDELIHHKSPLYGHRTVTGADLEKFLSEQFADEFKLYSLVKDHPNFRVHFREDALKNKKWHMAKNHIANYDRTKLRDSGLSDAQIDKLMSEYSTVEGRRGFQEVSIPNPGKGPIIAPLPALKRQASYRELLPKPEGKRRFFRMWVRAEPRTDKL
jgi:ribosomal protein S18 acetylase RimI-like enzyme